MSKAWLRSLGRRRAPEEYVCAAAMLFALTVSLAWGTLLPVGGAGPDEPAHMAVATHVARTAKLPDPVGDPAFRPKVIGITPYRPPLPWPIEGISPSGALLAYPYVSYATQPPAPYVVAAVAIKLPGAGANNDTHQARLPQALAATFITLVAFLLARVMFPSTPAVAALTAVLAATWPRMTFTASYVNNDTLTALVGGLVVWRWWVAHRSSWSWRNTALIGMALGGLLVCKPNGWLLVAMSLIAATIDLQRPFRRGIAKVIAAGVIAVAVAAPWLWVATRRYGLGDLLGQHDATRLLAELRHDDLSGSAMGISYVEMLRGYWFSNFSRSALAVTQVDTIVFVLVGGLLALIGIGLVFAVVERRGAWKDEPRTSLLMTLTALLAPLLLLAASINSYHHDAWFGEQGRYAFPAFAPIVVFSAFGLLNATQHPARARVLLMTGTCVMLLLSWTTAARLFGSAWTDIGDGGTTLVVLLVGATTAVLVGAVIAFILASSRLERREVMSYAADGS